MQKNATIRILKLFKSQKKTVVFLFVLVAVATGLDVSVPLISQKLIDRLIVLSADMILVFNDGRVEARGKHNELLEISPTYRRLYSLQFQDQSANVVFK